MDSPRPLAPSVTVQRQMALRSRLPFAQLVAPVEQQWIHRRCADYIARWLPDRDIQVTTDLSQMSSWSGVPIADTVMGMITRCSSGSAFLFINSACASTGWFADTVIGHEITHLRFRSLGHSQRFFVRAQETLDALGTQSL